MGATTVRNTQAPARALAHAIVMLRGIGWDHGEGHLEKLPGLLDAASFASLELEEEASVTERFYLDLVNAALDLIKRCFAGGGLEHADQGGGHAAQHRKVV